VHPLRSFAQRFGSRPWFIRMVRLIVPIDGVLQKATGARFGLTEVAGIDGLVLTTIGRRSGEPRSVTLIYAERAGSYVVAGSNWGGQRHPAWSANLLAEPQATVSVHGRTEKVKARLVTGAERERCWALLLEHWPAYATYQDRIDRTIRVFVLEPVR
jgi:deazaflavin-dependent oxidoreductase (nitroreductase family)